ncbi:Enoyl-CoA hydratase [hydrothermal vent metagenome]|uniref:Enoyl-CoA hydratase n=1 Tax=hydrothermal vent metagenome TaxID=652676 RepID=A0A3B0RE16_9ZZZZ
MTYQTLNIEEEYNGQVAVITLNDPPANILTAAMMAEIRTFLKDDASNQDRKMLIFKGAGDHFCFGASVEEHTAEQVDNMLPGFHMMIGDILAHPVPTLAQVSGFCLGGGFELAIACGLIFAGEKSKYAVPEIQLGVFPPVAAALLPFLANGVTASHMLLTGAKLSAKQMKDCGIVNEVIPLAELDQYITDYVEKNILPRSASSLRFANRAVRMSVNSLYRQHICDLERLYLDELMKSHDANEGINAFLAKRPAEWKNR